MDENPITLKSFAKSTALSFVVSAAVTAGMMTGAMFVGYVTGVREEQKSKKKLKTV
jgi:hypothetical protein